jgi:Ca-activated chloride channel family protein
MTGYPVETSKAVVRYALAHMNPEDTFQIIRFGDSASNLSPTPLPNTAENVARGLSFIDAMAGGGGTMMTAGIHAALGPPPDPDRMRIVLFLTDGFIGNETEILALIDQEVGQSRLFSLGVGSSVNRFLLDRMAERGRGVVHYVNLGEQPDAVVEAFYSRFRNPILTDVTVDFHGFQVEGLQPDQELIPDVFAGTPIQLTGRYRQGGATEATIRGRLGTRPVSYELDLSFPSEGSDRPAIANLWARRHIEAIEARYAHQQGAARNEVLPLALEYGLLTQYTAFVAIEERINPDARDPLRTVGVPVALPAGMTDVNVGPQVLSLPGAGRSEGSSMAGASPVMPSSAAPTQMQAEEAPMFAALDRAREASQVPAGISPAGHAAATIDSVTIGGALQREPVTSTLRLHTVVLQQCYQSRLDLQPGLRGSIILSFVVDPSGAVSQARIVGSTLGDEALNLCVVRSLASLRFSSPSDGSPATITVSIAFRPV